MLPKTIHYCWFGGKPLPPLAVKCIDSWKKYMPDYTIKEWNESNFDVNAIPYAAQSYSAKKYAFVSDYARFKILYEQGGIYLDVDVELIKSLSPLVDSANVVLGMERAGKVAPGLIIIAPLKNDFIQEMIEAYNKKEFIINGEMNLSTIVEHTTNILKEKGLRESDSFQRLNGVDIYPKDYFCPIDMDTNKLMITENTYSIHHYAASWVSGWAKFKKAVRKAIGSRVYNFLYRLKNHKRIKKQQIED